MSKIVDNENFVKFVQDRLGLKVDGWAGKLTREKIEPLLPKVEAANSIASDLQVDERSEKNIKTLHPKIQDKAREFVIKANQYLGLVGQEVKIISGTRTYEEQDTLYAQGRTRPGDVVTNARGGYSNHNFSIAFDIGIFSNGKYLGESPAYKELSTIGKALGFEWGGDWKSIKDFPHYEWPTGLTLAQMREHVANGKDVLA